MAIGTPTERYAQSRSAQGATTTFSPTATIAAGSFVVLVGTTSFAGKVISGVADDAGGNTWPVDVTHAPAQAQNVSVVSCQIATQLTTSSVITITWAVTNNNLAEIWLQQISGIVTSGAFDKSAVGQGTNTIAATPFTTAASATLSQADEIVFVGCRAADITGWTKGAAFTDVTTPILGSRSGLEYAIVAATTAVTGSATHSNTSSYGMLLATYKGAVSARSPRNPAVNFQDPAYV